MMFHELPIPKTIKISAINMKIRNIRGCCKKSANSAIMVDAVPDTISAIDTNGGIALGNPASYALRIRRVE